MLLTAISLIAQITAVIISITFPLGQNTPLVVAGKLSGPTSWLCAISMFVWTVATIIIKIADKSFRDTSCVIARELVTTTIWQRGSCKVKFKFRVLELAVCYSTGHKPWTLKNFSVWASSTLFQGGSIHRIFEIDVYQQWGKGWSISGIDLFQLHLEV